MRTFFRILHYLFFARALRRGPRYFAGYEIRRQVRKASYRATRNMK